MQKKILLLGSGELGKEFTIAAQRLGQYVVAVDRYAKAPAMQVAHESEVINMLDGHSLDGLVEKHRPDIIVPEIEAIRTERFYDYEKRGIQVVPSAKAANFTMDRKAIRDLAAFELGLKTANFIYADSYENLCKAVNEIKVPCVIKPLMSSSGKGQEVIRTNDENVIKAAWNKAISEARGDKKLVIVEELIDFHTEITLLTVTQNNGQTLFCSPIGHIQKGGDYQESWQPAGIDSDQLEQAKEMAKKVTENLGGSGIWGVEFFLTDDDVYFSELSPRPHDTGMVTLAGTQNFNQFELHLKAVLGLPIPQIILERCGASAVILATHEKDSEPEIRGLERALECDHSQVRIFGKPSTRKNRRMGVALSYGKDLEESLEKVRARAKEVASSISIH